jgi:hypothetical protein
LQGKTSIVRRSDAVKKLFLNKEHMVMYEKGSLKLLADSIKTLIDYKRLSEKIAENADKLYIQELMLKKLSSHYLSI